MAEQQNQPFDPWHYANRFNELTPETVQRYVREGKRLQAEAVRSGFRRLFGGIAQLFSLPKRAEQPEHGQARTSH